MQTLQSLDHITYEHTSHARFQSLLLISQSCSWIIRDCCLELSPRNPTVDRDPYLRTDNFGALNSLKSIQLRCLILLYDFEVV